MKKGIYRLFIFIFFGISLLFFSACEYLQKSEYTLTYSTIGNGYVECAYESGSVIDANTYINLIAKGNGNFEGWYLNNELFESDNDILILLNSDLYF